MYIPYSQATTRLSGIFLLIIAFSSPILFAQSRMGTGLADADRLLSQEASTFSAASQAPSGFPTDSPVHPDYYYLGAGDVLMLEIVGPVSLAVPIVVSPESTILLPRFGEVLSAGKTLTQVRTEIQRLVQARNPSNKAFLTLQRSRTVYVRITGNVAQAGLYTLPASLRVSTAVQIANQEIVQQGSATPSARAASGERRNSLFAQESSPNGQYSISFAQRNIKVLHRDGRSDIADALRSRLASDAAADPCLREGDEIYVPFEHEAGEMVSIAGEVQRPCIIPFRKGDKISLLIKAAYGLTDNADSNSIRITEAVSAGNGSESARILALQDILSGKNDGTLTGGMSVLVRASEQATKRRSTVTVVGEVKNPGVYAIESGTTRIKSVLQLTGGFTANAHLPLSNVVRRENKALMLPSSFSSGASMMNSSLEALKNTQYTTLTPEDTSSFRMQENMRRPTVACDIQALMEKGSEVDNITLQDGDVIMIASSPKNVYIYGHVAKPGFVDYTPERDANWYIQASGGFAGNADTARTRIIKAKNRLWLEPRITSGMRKGETTAIEAGDQIYIPRVPDSNTNLGLQRLTVELQRDNYKLQERQIELQQQGQVWQIISAIVGIITAGVAVYAVVRP
ncbi:MAG: hypothetical protein EAZ92_05565 [Candidatus Kapaibacterium sp.]|nr:MAG: hypothetical protein EAZ92_05565 [Candidatus Kapabacteria bacterium]